MNPQTLVITVTPDDIAAHQPGYQTALEHAAIRVLLTDDVRLLVPNTLCVGLQSKDRHTDYQLSDRAKRFVSQLNNGKQFLGSRSFVLRRY